VIDWKLTNSSGWGAGSFDSTYTLTLSPNPNYAVSATDSTIWSTAFKRKYSILLNNCSVSKGSSLSFHSLSICFKMAVLDVTLLYFEVLVMQNTSGNSQ
jgi:hypothetical protein